MDAAKESFFIKLLLFISCSSTGVVFCQSQEFTCFSSTDCHGNSVEGDFIAECCAIGGGLSFEENTGECGNCFTDEKFESQGEKFYLAIFGNYEPSSYFRIAQLRLAVEPVGNEMTTFMVDVLGTQTMYTAPKEVSMESDPLGLESASRRDRGIFVKSESGDPLSVIAYVEEYQSSDTFKVFPCVTQPVMAYEYYAVSVPVSRIILPPDPLDPDYEEVLDPQGNSAVVIVTTEENTVLDVTLTQDVSISGADDIIEQIGTDLLRAGEQVTFQLSARGSTLYLASLDDLTGSRVIANKPIAFISGHECGTLPRDVQYCDHLVEQITPTSTWGKEFIISTVATRKNDTFRIIASRNDTSVSVTCNITEMEPINLNTAGSFIEFHINVNSSDSCYLESNQPLLVAQYSVSSLVDRVFNSDPFLVIVPPIEQYRTSYIFNIFTGSRNLFTEELNYINILLPAGVDHEGLHLDDQPLSADDALVTPIQCSDDGGTICATTVQLKVSGAQHNLNHIDDGARFNAIVYGLSFRVAHGYSVGMTQNPIALPSVSFQRSNFEVFENESMVAIQLTRSEDTSLPATVFVSTAEISAGSMNALSGEDFVAVSQMAVEFGPDEDQATVMIDIVDDVFPENTEEFEVFLSASPGVYIVSPAYANVTVFNDDPALPVMNVSFAETSFAVTEGVGVVTLTLEKTLGALGPVAVRIFTTNGSAVDGEDFEGIDDVITFEMNDLRKTTLILVLDNLSYEGVEEFSVHIEPVDGEFPVAVQNSTATITIRDNDVVILGFDQPTYFVNEEDGQLMVSVSISHGSLERSVVATVETVSGSAVGDEDFMPEMRVLSFDSSSTSQNVRITIINDNQLEMNEMFNLRLTIEEEDSLNVILSPNDATVTIVDTDQVEISVLPMATTVREGEGSARVNVSVTDGMLDDPVTIAMTTFNINSTGGGVDYSEVSREISLSQSVLFQEVLVSIIDDTEYEGPEDETFLIVATLVSGDIDRIDVPTSSQIITIEDNDPRPIAFVEFSETSYTTVEDAQEIVLLLRSDGINRELLTVDYFYLSGNAQDGSDIIFVDGTLEFPPGSTTAAIIVPIIDDGIAELPETFTVQLTPSNDILIADSATVTVTILDDDVVNVGFGQMMYTVTEGGEAEVILTIAKTTLTDRTVLVVFSTLDGTSQAGVDYEQVNQLVTFSPDENTRQVTVGIIDNQIQEFGPRLFFGVLRSLSIDDVNISMPTASILILDDELFRIPSRPLNFEVISQTTSVRLTWDQPSTDMVDLYNIVWTYLSPCEQGPPERVSVEGTARFYDLDGLEENSNYSISIQARNRAGNSPEAITFGRTGISAPSGAPNLQSVSTTPTSITIEWSEIECLDQNGVITSYDIRLNGGVVLTTSQTQATITELTPITTYFIDVRGRNSIGVGPFSSTVAVMTTDIDECAIGTDDCVDDASCVNTEGSFTCTCPTGFTGNGQTSGSGCTDIDECVEGTDDCGEGFNCINTPGSFTCDDIDECDIEIHDCVDDATCMNTDGSFICTCPPGFRGDGRESGNGCTDIDECIEGTHNCGEGFVCFNTPGSFTCDDIDECFLGIDDCEEGFSCVNTRGSFTCDDIDECFLGIDDCVDDATCMNTDGSFTCTCPPGYRGDGRDILSGNGCTDINECIEGTHNCGDGFNCINTPGSFECDDINECAIGTDDCVDVASCVNTIGSFTCACPPGFTGNGQTSGSGCTDIDECLLRTDDCVDTATCVNTVGSFTCTCQSGFVGNGRTSGSGCTDVDECAMGTDDCVDAATCQNTAGSFTCTCPAGFIGDGRASPIGTGCTEEVVQCFFNSNVCQQEDAPPPLLVTRRECCVTIQSTSSSFRAGGSNTCNACVVFGFFQSTFTASERGEGYGINVGYLKRPQTGSVPALSFTVSEQLLGTTTVGDFLLQTAVVTVAPNQGSRQVVFTFLVDTIAQESEETVRLRLSASQEVLNRFAGQFNDSVFFLDTADLVIVDSNTLELSFTDDDYRSSEPELSLPVRVTKSTRIANPVTVRVTPVTLTQHRATERPDPPGTLEDDPDSPIEADSNDFDSSPVFVTFQPDETGPPIHDVDTPIPIVNDSVNEAKEQNFVATLDVISASSRSRITVVRRDSLCRIIDDDVIAIGFQRSSYTFVEPPGSEFENIVDVVLLAKEDGVVSEQTFSILVTDLAIAPDQFTGLAEPSRDGINNDYMIGISNFIVLLLPPDLSTVSFNFRLFGDDIVEGTEAFQVTSSSVEGMPEFSPPRFRNTFIIIEDNDVCGTLGALRLVDGSNTMEGRVEVCNGTTWGTVCDDVWDFRDAMVICRQLGFPTNAIARSTAYFGRGSGPIVLDNVQCTGSETRILDCPANAIGDHNCVHAEDAGVTCGPSSTPQPTGPIDLELSVRCFADPNCVVDATTPVLMTVRECCVLTGNGIKFEREGSEVCSDCVVFGFFQSTFTAPEQGESYAIDVGYLKRPQTGSVPALSFTVSQLGGTSQVSDFNLQTHVVTVGSAPNQGSGEVVFTFQPDSIAQELDETVRLQLSLPQAALDQLRDYIFIESADLVIVDSDVLELQFTDDDYRASEPELSLPVRVTKNTRIANPVTVSVAPVTLTQHRLTGRPDPPGTLEDDLNSPIEADSNDFNISPVFVTFQPDETGPPIHDVDTPIPIVDDSVNEAKEQNFVVTLDVVSAMNPSSITIALRDSLCRITDNDPITIGFQRPSYTFTEPPVFENILNVVLLEKQSGVVSEQTFIILVTDSPIAPGRGVQPAEPSSDGVDNDYTTGVDFIVLLLPPDSSTVSFNFRLFGDDIAEGTEAFLATASRVEDTPEFFVPPVLSSALILIEDDDE